MLEAPGRRRRRRMRSGLDSVDDERMCWICLATQEEMPRNDWLHPCRCRGSNKWVHESCLSRWIDEKQLISPDVPVACTQCRTEYIVVMPPLCQFDAVLEYLDKTCTRLCPSAIMGMVAATLYFSGVTYGALTLLQLTGYEKGLRYLHDDPTLLMIVLPVLPTVLLLGRVIHWDEWLLHWLRRFNRQPMPQEQLDTEGEPLPGAPLDDNYFEAQERLHSQPVQLAAINPEHIMRASSNFCTALSLPTISIFFGGSLYSGVENKLLASLLGAITYVSIKGVVNMYLRQCKYQRTKQRYVQNHTLENMQQHRRQNRVIRARHS